MHRSLSLLALSLASLTSLAAGCAVPADGPMDPEGSVVETRDDSLLAVCDPKYCPTLRLTAADIELTTTYNRAVAFTLNISASGVSASQFQTSERADFSDATWRPMFVNGVRQPIRHTIAGATGSKTIYVRVRGYHAFSSSYLTSNALSDTVRFIERSVRTVSCVDAFTQARSRGFTFTATNATPGGWCRIEPLGDSLRLTADGYLWDDADCTFTMFSGRRLREHWAIRSVNVINTTGSTDFTRPVPLDGNRTIPEFVSTERKKAWEAVPAYAWCDTLVLEGPVTEDSMMAFSDANLVSL